MGEIIQNVGHAHPTFIEEEIVYDVDMVENEVRGKQMKKTENVITDDEINDDTDEQEEELLADKYIEEEDN